MIPLPLTSSSRFRQMIPTIIGLASNVRGGENPPYDIYTFAEIYPQFFAPSEEPELEIEESVESTNDDIELTPVVPMIFLQALIELAHASVKYSRFRDAWKICMGFFIAHFVTLYLATMKEPGATPYELAKAGQAGGLVSSKSVDGVSVNYDFSQMTDDLDGWAEWKATAYGLQFATYAKLFSMAGMYIH